MSWAKAAVLEQVGRPLVLREFAVPEPQEGETLVDVIASTICGSDLHSLHGRRSVPLPTILGHEILGRVAAFGPRSTGRDASGQPLAIGDRVTWAVVAHCGDCFYCLRDLPQKCLRQVKYGHEPLRPGRELNGGLAEKCVLVAGTSLFRVPDELSDAAACPANCATATIAAALEAAGTLEGRHVLVLGAGMLGLTAVAWARALGAADVLGCDIAVERLPMAATFGAARTCTPDELAATVAEMTAGHGVDVALELSGSPEAFEAALPRLRIGGRMVLVGSVFPGRAVPISLEQLVRRCVTLRGVHNYAPRHLASALAFLVQQRELPFEALVAPWRPLSAINDALAILLVPPWLRIGIRVNQALAVGPGPIEV
jgi:alcohol dehydrogenase